jgi:hypothetical protein
VRWAQANAGVADVVITDDVDALGGAVDRLSRDPAYRASLANTSQQVGNRDFSAAAAESIFHSALHGATQ